MGLCGVKEGVRMDEYGIAAFRSRQQVMRMEEALKNEGLSVQVISTPRDIAVGCGLSVRFAVKDLKTVQRVLNRMRPDNLVGVYRVDRTGGRMRVTAVTKHG